MVRHCRRLISKWRWRLAILATGLLLVGCQGEDRDQPYETYLSRLARTLSGSVPEVTFDPSPLPPRSARLQLAIAGDKLDALDFLALSGCALQVTIGKRNSSLGRMAKPSQRLLLELEFLRLAPECIAWQQQQGREQLSRALQQARDSKRRQLPSLIFNATLGGEEYRALWRKAAAGRDPRTAGSGVASALRAIDRQATRWLAGDYQADNRAFELLLAEVASGDGGALLNALLHQQGWLAGANQILDRRLARGPLCQPDRRPAAADILPNVIHKYFVGGTQQRAAALGRHYHELLPPVRSLEQRLGAVLPAGYVQWQEARDDLLLRAVAAPRAHVEKLLSIQLPCNEGG